MIAWEIDWRSPVAAFAPLAGEPHAHLLHAGAQSRTPGWSVLVAFPAAVITGGQGRASPFAALDAALTDRRPSSSLARTGLPFASGALGFAGYEAARFLEAGLSLPPSPYALPDCAFGLYDAAALFLRNSRKAYIAGRCETACRRLRDALGVDEPAPPRLPPFGPVSSSVSRQAYEDAVGQVIENILNGDYYQANLSHRLGVTAQAALSSFDLFRKLIDASDAFHGALLQFSKGAVISNSPERFFRIDVQANGERRIVAEPIKGTRPRGASPAADAAQAKALQTDPKDRAENIMIADLLRNDLSRICRDGSLREDAICKLMSLATVHHLVSRISGILRDGVPLSEIFAALFPCGSITGAPKIEAMKAIARLEGAGRGPYCGAIGYIDDRGGADWSVAIRTMIVEERQVAIPVGGGVTLRSDPSAEHHETLVKARANLAALGVDVETPS